MHTIKLLLTYYLNISVQAANLSDCRIESNRNFFARIGMLYYWVVLYVQRPHSATGFIIHCSAEHQLQAVLTELLHCSRSAIDRCPVSSQCLEYLST